MGKLVRARNFAHLKYRTRIDETPSRAVSVSSAHQKIFLKRLGTSADGKRMEWDGIGRKLVNARQVLCGSRGKINYERFPNRRCSRKSGGTVIERRNLPGSMRSNALQKCKAIGRKHLSAKILGKFPYFAKLYLLEIESDPRTFGLELRTRVNF